MLLEEPTSFRRPFRLEPEEEARPSFGRVLGDGLQSVREAFRVRDPRSGVPPAPDSLRLLAGIPTGVNPPDIGIEAGLGKSVLIAQLILFGRRGEFLSRVGRRAYQKRRDRPPLRSGQEVGAIPAAP